jgi:hypothetical protein
MLCIYLPVELTKPVPTRPFTGYHSASLLNTAKRVAPGYAARSQLVADENNLPNTSIPVLLQSVSTPSADVMWTHPSGLLCCARSHPDNPSMVVDIFGQPSGGVQLVLFQSLTLTPALPVSVRILTGTSAPLTFRYRETRWMFVTVGTRSGYGREIIVVQRTHDATQWSQVFIIRHPDEALVAAASNSTTTPDAGAFGHRLVCSLDRSLFSPRLLLYANGTQYKIDEPGGMIFVFAWSNNTARYLYKIQDLKLFLLNEQRRFVPARNRLLSFGHFFTVEPNILGQPMLWVSNPSSEDGHEVGGSTEFIPRRNPKGYVQGFVFDALSGWSVDRTSQYWGFRYPNTSTSQSLQDMPDGFGYTFQLLQRELRVMCGSPITVDTISTTLYTYPVTRLTLNLRPIQTVVGGLPMRALIQSTRNTYRPLIGLFGRMVVLVSIFPGQPTAVWSVPSSVTASLSTLGFQAFPGNPPLNHDTIESFTNRSPGIGYAQSLCSWSSSTQRTLFLVINNPVSNAFSVYYVKYSF